MYLTTTQVQIYLTKCTSFCLIFFYFFHQPFILFGTEIIYKFRVTVTIQNLILLMFYVTGIPASQLLKLFSSLDTDLHPTYITHFHGYILGISLPRPEETAISQVKMLHILAIITQFGCLPPTILHFQQSCNSPESSLN